MSKKLRLVEVRVQPVFMVDDGESLTALEHPVMVIPAPEWPTYSSERFPRETAAFAAQLESGELETPAPAPNRAQRRKKAPPARKRR